ncbi:hypothetical protein BDQ94DRAFT_149643 [Aspergillus welwitschiae]|uniref:Uncharacterized protein n=2 Tax=Aspergillus subgen. Circumdati TaxID=2720871 RepID=A0A3F3PSG9_9EURO|nr:uncharacterized protein BO96DRAFT_409225 [Aspergillus niger CBS 101883]XP_026622899.1 hypothetical protein BDQ94DRAFT_149643 [Aspergillus welwitschiae]PYH59986.1 hypothetical protein BO96DRAFT_409225 [Aspergillus niger CBS 101883]RDH24367.1 hypothetical protein M747DRAFT_292798 [Aspergillus niger ATCC 13496]RDH29877.1 hypothetical protein BDQ94DRAFT_149643 [Aspergillus welwitschiae]
MDLACHRFSLLIRAECLLTFWPPRKLTQIQWVDRVKGSDSPFHSGSIPPASSARIPGGQDFQDSQHSAPPSGDFRSPMPHPARLYSSPIHLP